MRGAIAPAGVACNQLQDGRLSTATGTQAADNHAVAQQAHELIRAEVLGHPHPARTRLRRSRADRTGQPANTCAAGTGLDERRRDNAGSGADRTPARGVGRTGPHGRRAPRASRLTGAGAPDR